MLEWRLLLFSLFLLVALSHRYTSDVNEPEPELELELELELE